jgi:hypothetical protein
MIGQLAQERERDENGGEQGDEQGMTGGMGVSRGRHQGRQWDDNRDNDGTTTTGRQWRGNHENRGTATNSISTSTSTITAPATTTASNCLWGGLQVLMATMTSIGGGERHQGQRGRGDGHHQHQHQHHHSTHNHRHKQLLVGWLAGANGNNDKHRRGRTTPGTTRGTRTTMTGLPLPRLHCGGGADNYVVSHPAPRKCKGSAN